MSESPDRFDDALPGEEALSSLYAQTATTEPGAHVDSAVLRVAREAVTPTAAPFAGNWYRRFSWAAVVVVSVTVVTVLQDQDGLQHRTLPAGQSELGDRPEEVTDAPIESQAVKSAPTHLPDSSPEPPLEDVDAGRAPVRKLRSPMPGPTPEQTPSAQSAEPRDVRTTTQSVHSDQLLYEVIPATPEEASEALFNLDVAPAAAPPAKADASGYRRSESRADLKEAKQAAPPRATIEFAGKAEPSPDTAREIRPSSDAWLQRIKRMLDAGQREDAARMLWSFRQHYPEYPESELRQQLGVDPAQLIPPGVADPVDR